MTPKKYWSSYQGRSRIQRRRVTERLNGLRYESISEDQVKDNIVNDGRYLEIHLMKHLQHMRLSSADQNWDHSASVDKMLPEASKSELEEADVELKLANKQLEAKQFKGAMELIEKLRTRKNSTLYKLASDSA